MSARARIGAAFLAALATLVLGVFAAWPIYDTAWLWIVAAAALVIGAGAVLAQARWRLGFVVFIAILVGLFALTVLPVAVPTALANDPVRGLIEGFAAVALGWKQVLTLDLPVGTYQTVLVPAYVVFLTSVVLIFVLALRPRLTAVFAAVPMLVPVAFGTVFGASVVSAPLHMGPFTVVAPREIGLWLAAALCAAVWIGWIAGAKRRAALRLGRAEGESTRTRGAVARGMLGAAGVVIALIAGVALAPVLDSGTRAVARDRVIPEIVVKEAPSPLAAYRSAKRDGAIDEPLFSVASSGALPERLHLAVLDAYDGVDFHVGDEAAGRFKRFPTGPGARQPVDMSIEIMAGFTGLWVPLAPLASPPRFAGPRAALLADSFYLNRDSGTGIAVPADADSQPGLNAGDEFTATVDAASDSIALSELGTELGGPARGTPLLDVDQLPELERWLEAQKTTDIATLIDRLRNRGYLSHSLTDGEGEQLWLERLSEAYGARFEPSAGGHSLARIEALFKQLNDQQSAAGDQPDERQLIAGIGDDEQFATAAALIARVLGFDSRTVVGVRLDGEEVPGVPFCDGVCTGDNLAAWTEIRGASDRWIPVDVTPQMVQPPQRIEEGEQLPEFATIPEERDAREIDPPVGLGEQNERGSDEGSGGEESGLWPVLRAVGLGAAALALLLLPILFLPLAKRARARARRKGGEAELRALGAWEELTDRARDAGVPIPRGESRTEVADAIGTETAMRVANGVDRAVFSARGITRTDADMLWDAVDDDTDERRQRMTAWQKLRSAYSLRSYGVRFGRTRRGQNESEGS